MAQLSDRIYIKLDKLMASGSFPEAVRHLRYWISDAEFTGNTGGKISLLNELMGVLRKAGLYDDAIKAAEEAVFLSSSSDYADSELRATVMLNTGTVYSASGDYDKALEYYKEAKKYFTCINDSDPYKLASLLNNMSVAYGSLEYYEEAESCLIDALCIVDYPETYTECAVTYLNLADVYLTWLGSEKGAVRISNCLSEARKRLDSPETVHDENYYFQCSKCITGFEIYGDTEYAEILRRRCSERT